MRALRAIDQFRATANRLGASDAWEAVKFHCKVPCLCVNCVRTSPPSRNALARVVRYLREVRRATES